MDFLFFPTVNDWEENVFQLTPPGLITVGVLFVLLLLVAILLRPKNRNIIIMATKQLIFSSVAMALAIVTAQIKFTRLPMGGSITLFSMFFVVLIGYWYGFRAGVLTGFSYGLLQFILDPVFYTPVQLLLDYPLAFCSLGFAGAFSGKKNGLVSGYLVGVLGRFLFHYVSGVVFFSHYAPENMPSELYSLTYNASYIVPEALVTLILIGFVPPIKNAIAYISMQATSSSWTISSSGNK